MQEAWCKKCGGLLFEEYVMTPEGSTQMKKCSMCGARYFVNDIKETRRKCKHCGEEFVIYADRGQKVCNECQKKRSKKKKKREVCINCGKDYFRYPHARTRYCKDCLAKLKPSGWRELRKQSKKIGGADVQCK